MAGQAGSPQDRLVLKSVEKVRPAPPSDRHFATPATSGAQTVVNPGAPAKAKFNSQVFNDHPVLQVVAIT
jgi:hypothetical protein